ncbi:MBL fold metallo-hydrolase [Xanthomonas sp. D-109]|uniref:MBL fold metallo-hydrolase n=1 Tax=Xanthomonas sp. D-109 TaxID=2821274 RepID=UPI001ADA3579|nr:MBL fold metallo-hydrolase [Xanthomonas sp. D-109]MBO9882798.1 MBL fold metallo-hydrolase [Xanthomonas sp. D-109]
MSAPRLQWRLYEAGHCTHPERATRRGAPLAPCPFPALAALLQHPQHGDLLFDTGYSPHFFDATARFPERLYRWLTPVHLAPGQSLREQLARDGVDADRIGWIVLSHFHGDHVGGVADFPHARLACAQQAWDDLQRRGRLTALREGFLPALLHGARPRMHWIEALPAATTPAALRDFGTPRDLFGDASVLLVPLPGHAPGHYGLWFEDAHGPVFLIADAAWSSAALADGTPPPALVTHLLGEHRVYRDTLARLHALRQAAPQVRLVPSHCRQWRPAPAEHTHD